MSTGGVPGIIVTLDGKTGSVPGPATTTLAEVLLNSPYTRATTLAVNKRYTTFRNLRVRHVSGAGDLRIYLNGSPSFITVKPGDPVFIHEGYVHKLVVAASAGSVDWEGTAAAA